MKSRRLAPVLHWISVAVLAVLHIMGEAGQGSIIVKNLDASIDNQALYDTFSLFGNILSCKVECGIDGKSTGSGIVHFEEKDSAKQAIDSVNDMKIGENTVTVEQYTGDPSDEVHAWLR